MASGIGKLAFNDYIIGYFLDKSKKTTIKKDILRLFTNGKIEDLESIIKRLFASIAYNNFTKNDIANYEGFYASVLYAYFSSLGLELIAEDITNQGRIDLTIKLNNRVFIFEFKVNNEDALFQIKEKKYYEKYISKDSI